MDILQILILAIVQGAAELLPVSSSAHVIVAEKLMGLDPTAPAMTLILVMLHTGTMLAVIVYFWQRWRSTYFSSREQGYRQLAVLIGATAVTGVIGLTLQYALKHLFMNGDAHFEIEMLFGNARLMAAALAAAGVLIIVSSRLQDKPHGQVNMSGALLVGAVQGLCLPFRGFSRSGATISTGMVLGMSRRRAEEFSFALAVVLTPAVILKEAYRLIQHQAHAGAAGASSLLQMFGPGLIGMVFSFAAGLLALRWLSNWLENGRWIWFGAYCLAASLVVLYVG